MFIIPAYKCKLRGQIESVVPNLWLKTRTMAMSLVNALLLLACATPSFAFWFVRSQPVATSDGREIEETCLAKADTGDCDFYSCFERRLPCGRNWYILRTGLYYCNKMERQRQSFSIAGQRFLNDSRTCLTMSLKALYGRDYINCHELEHEAISAIGTCFADHGFCDIFRTDAEHFLKVYEFSDLFSRGAAKVWRAVFNLATQCGGEAVREFSSNTGERVIDGVNSLFQSLSDRIGKK